VVCDVTSLESVQAAADIVEKSFGKVDILVNNAGGGRPLPAEECSREDWKDLIDMNLNSVFYCAQTFGRIMLKNGYGRIINIASMYGLVGSLGTKNIPYAAAKGGVVNFTRGLASEWASRGVNVNAICPGYFKSEATEKLFDIVTKIAEEKTPIHRPGKDGELDAAVVFLASEEASYVVGAILPVDGGYTCV
jgi:NAD(P)-dependent dehydrogenase (short-subunit alcohol dehydrogenase family)